MTMPKARKTPQTSWRGGVVAPAVALSLVAVVGITAIVMDGGINLTERRQAQATADAAALAAAEVLYVNYPKQKGNGPKDEAVAAALALAAGNGYTNDGVRSSVSVRIPPTTGPYAGRPGFAEVVVTFQQTRTFSRIFGSNDIPVVSRAVAKGEWTAGKNGVIVLDYTGKGALNSQGNGAFTETGAPVIVNSNHAEALIDTGNGSMIAQEFDITGGLKLGRHASFQTWPVPGQIFLGMHPTPDPLAYLPVPAVPPNGTVTHPTSPVTIPGLPTLTDLNRVFILTPGRHSSLPTFTKGDTVILKQASANGAKGVYYIDGGGFKSTGANVVMDPTTTGGAMIYNNPRGTASSEKIQVTGNASGYVNLSPLTDEGPYKGILLWQERSSPVDLLVEGNGKFTMKGTFYAAGAKLNVNGNGGTYFEDDGSEKPGSRTGSQFIVKDMSLGGNGNIIIKYNIKDVAMTRSICLVE
jgi:hypothetical protein